MSRLDWDKLTKVLALADSDKQGEALAALHQAKRMLESADLSFRDLGEGAAEAMASAERSHYDADLVMDLEREVDELRRDLAEESRDVEKWKRIAWQNLTSKAEEPDELDTTRRVTKAAAAPRRSQKHIRETVLAFLNNPEHRSLSDREIARRAGVSPQTVSNWRKRLAADSGEAPLHERTFVRGGKTYRMKTANIGQRRRAKHPAEDAGS